MKEYAGQLTDEEMATGRWENEGGRMAVAQNWKRPSQAESPARLPTLYE